MNPNGCRLDELTPGTYFRFAPGHDPTNGVWMRLQSSRPNGIVNMETAELLYIPIWAGDLQVTKVNATIVTLPVEMTYD